MMVCVCVCTCVTVVDVFKWYNLSRFGRRFLLNVGRDEVCLYSNNNNLLKRVNSETTMVEELIQCLMTH